MNEAEAISAAKKGNLSAFNQLVMAHQGLVYNVAYRIMGNGDAAADATQDAFLKAFKSIKQYHGGAFKSWLMRIVTNTCYDQLRYQKRRPAEPLENEAGEIEYAAQVVDIAEQPEDVAIRHELNDMLQIAIDKLPPDQRLVLILSDMEGFSYQEIATITEVSLGTVKSRLNRARVKLRGLLQHQELLPQRYRLNNEDS